MKHAPLAGTSAVAENAGQIDFIPTDVSARRDGWTGERQRAFIAALAQTGCVAKACDRAGISARSAYRLRRQVRGAHFARAWDLAMHVASDRLSAPARQIAAQRSLSRMWRDHTTGGDTLPPTEQALIFLLSRLVKRRGKDRGM